MKLLSINVGREREIQRHRTLVKTGIYKEPLHTSAYISATGLTGDTISDRKHHGGADQAVYVYGAADYTWWEKMLNRELVPGTFGENLTISGLESSRVNVGDQLCLGDAIIEVTAPRIPCETFAARMNDPDFVKKFRDAERPGFYCRVLQEGTVTAGDPVSLTEYAGATVSIQEMFQDAYKSNLSEAVLHRYLAAPISIRERHKKERRLQEIHLRN